MYELASNRYCSDEKFDRVIAGADNETQGTSGSVAMKSLGGKRRSRAGDENPATVMHLSKRGGGAMGGAEKGNGSVKLRRR